MKNREENRENSVLQTFKQKKVHGEGRELGGGIRAVFLRVGKKKEAASWRGVEAQAYVLRH